jgi:hypothetical protein
MEAEDWKGLIVLRELAAKPMRKRSRFSFPSS